ncbi:cytochrome P450 [Actinokineospora soli]|uniref:Cytochrome P450 n=1 Tax=Actinokineospora soli TaxID=1048753 RepID=A0ABW2TLF1_9PSEU
MAVDTEPLDLTSRDWLADPYPAYARMRADGGLHRSRRWDAWFASGHDTCHAVFADDRFDAAGQPMLRMLQAELLRGAESWRAPVFPSEGRGGDGLRAAGRRTTGRALGTPFVAGLWPAFERACRETAAAAVAAGSVDLVRDYAIPLTTGLLADLMAVGEAELPVFRAFAESGYQPQADDAAARRVVRDVRQALAEQVVDRIKCPVDDFVGHLAANPRTFPGGQESGSGHLEYVLGTGLMVSLVTHQGLVLSFSTLMRALLDHPEQYALLRAEPGLVAGAVEEGLRFDSSTQALGRRAKADVELGGSTIPREPGGVPDRVGQPGRAPVARR